jgi:hypothetical protein
MGSGRNLFSEGGKIRRKHVSCSTSLRGFGDSVKQNFLLNLLWLLFVILAGQKCAKDEWIPALITGAAGAASPADAGDKVACTFYILGVSRAPI